jgi:hypothetical protein
MTKQIIEIEISREWGSGKISIPWLTGVLAEKLEKEDVTRIEVKNIKRKEKTQ